MGLAEADFNRPGWPACLSKAFEGRCLGMRLQTAGSSPESFACFPMMCSLDLWVCSLAGPALEPQPGALPLLESFSWDAPIPTVQLPASWGAPDAWPALRTLRVVAGLRGTLPAAWADGFRRLETLSLAEPPVNPPGLLPHLSELEAAEKLWHSEADMCKVLSPRWLPPEWSHGFPALRQLTLSALCLSGPIPADWLNGTAFRHVTQL